MALISLQTFIEPLQHTWQFIRAALAGKREHNAAGHPNHAGAMIAPLIKCSWAQGRVTQPYSLAVINVKWLGRDQWSSAADELRSMGAGCCGFRYGQWFWFSQSECWLSHQTFWQRLNRTIMKVIVCFHSSREAHKNAGKGSWLHTFVWGLMCWNEWGSFLISETSSSGLFFPTLGVREWVPKNIFSHPFVGQSWEIAVFLLWPNRFWNGGSQRWVKKGSHTLKKIFQAKHTFYVI